MALIRAYRGNRTEVVPQNDGNLKKDHPKLHGFVYDPDIEFIITSAKYAPRAPEDEQLEMCALVVNKRDWQWYQTVLTYYSIEILGI